MNFTLRPWRLSDADSFLQIAREREVNRYMSGLFPTDKTAVVQWITRAMGEDKTKAITHCIDIGGRAVGAVFTRRGIDIFSPTAFLGYWIAPVYQGRGIVSSAVAQIVGETFALGVSRIQAEVFQGNASSMRVLQKNGFQLEAVQKQAVQKDGRLLDYYVFALLRAGHCAQPF